MKPLNKYKHKKMILYANRYSIWSCLILEKAALKIGTAFYFLGFRLGDFFQSLASIIDKLLKSPQLKYTYWFLNQ